MASFHRLEFSFFLQPERSSSWRALLLFGYGAAAVRLVVGLVTAGHQLAVGVASAIVDNFTEEYQTVQYIFGNILPVKGVSFD